MITNELVIEALKQVHDPELFINVVDLGLIYKVEIQDKTVQIDMALTSPACPSGPQMMGQAAKLIEAIEEGTKADIKLVLSPPWSPERMTEEARDQLGIF
jgi:metal-sulfur cluster biosynthetic enzyme